MDQPKNYAVLTNNTSKTKNLVHSLLSGPLPQRFEALENKVGLLFSRSEIHRFMNEEERHDVKIITQDTQQSLKTMSSGEQKKALLRHLLSQSPDFLVLVNPFDNLDVATQANLKEQLLTISKTTVLVQVVSRLEDILPITSNYFKLENGSLKSYPDSDSFFKANQTTTLGFQLPIPPPIQDIDVESDALVVFKNVSVSFDGRQVLNNISWTIKQGEFWQLIGPNGSGKTTLLSMVTGDSHKGYGKDLTLFGQKKGSGESVWDLKSKIGYFTPAMTDKFNGYHSVENMLVSGFHDSVGLYIRPSDHEKRVAKEWLKLLELEHKKDIQFLELTQGQKRLVMTARAMVKHPPLLILDEPTAGLDDANAALFIALVNKISNESNTTIVFVSHRKEVGLEPQFDYILEMGESGSKGTVK
ncbi:ATP-binding cassette domain-containing protein [Flagellimonas algicola]|uniref:ATP-binding cassette domain-containing protein n=1 Tax=Flagellimonas algicola TaxID=2583815 RepID=A0ABY2WQY2_9FLAO|nr:ATP-binding cassette domain-containing protein [Allomuricauda algicola]TMU57409.1 ATP-binding cassette domain-containing protein [Allomuricauda algicola]